MVLVSIVKGILMLFVSICYAFLMLSFAKILDNLQSKLNCKTVELSISSGNTLVQRKVQKIKKKSGNLPVLYEEDSNEGDDLVFTENNNCSDGKSVYSSYLLYRKKSSVCHNFCLKCQIFDHVLLPAVFVQKFTAYV